MAFLGFRLTGRVLVTKQFFIPAMYVVVRMSVSFPQALCFCTKMPRGLVWNVQLWTRRRRGSGGTVWHPEKRTLTLTLLPARILKPFEKKVAPYAPDFIERSLIPVEI